MKWIEHWEGRLLIYSNYAWSMHALFFLLYRYMYCQYYSGAHYSEQLGFLIVNLAKWMDYSKCYAVFNSISVTPGRWVGDNERLCGMEPGWRLKRLSPQAGIERETARSAGYRLSCWATCTGALQCNKTYHRSSSIRVFSGPEYIWMALCYYMRQIKYTDLL